MIYIKIIVIIILLNLIYRVTEKVGTELILRVNKVKYVKEVHLHPKMLY